MSTQSWLPMNWKPKAEGPYLIKVERASPKRPGETIITYLIKRWYFVDTKKRGRVGYFTSGNISPSTKMLEWMPIPGHSYDGSTQVEKPKDEDDFEFDLDEPIYKPGW